TDPGDPRDPTDPGDPRDPVIDICDEENTPIENDTSNVFINYPNSTILKDVTVRVLYDTVFQEPSYPKFSQPPVLCVFSNNEDLGSVTYGLEEKIKSLKFKNLAIGEPITACMEYYIAEKKYEECEITPFNPLYIYQPYIAITIQVPNHGTLEKCSPDTTVEEHFRMNACVSLHPSGEYNFKVNTWNDNHWEGFTGGFIAHFIDQEGKILDSTLPSQYGLNKCREVLFPPSWDCPKRVDVDPNGLDLVGKDVYENTADISIELKYAPKGWQERLEENLRTVERAAQQGKDKVQAQTGFSWEEIEQSTVGKWAGDALEATTGGRSTEDLLTIEKDCAVNFLIPLGGVPVPGCVGLKFDPRATKLKDMGEVTVSIMGAKIDDLTMKSDHIRLGLYIDLDNAINSIAGVDLSSMIKKVLGKDDDDLANANIIMKIYWKSPSIEGSVKTCYKVPEIKKELTPENVAGATSAGDLTDLNFKCHTEPFST
ncbi:MAG: hypothetical protein L0H55_14910, partial [Candidatus Nitrosocosmicus sp.]|nr:hypothetical protein [Candidatus Nitrosocosmicus sp.]